MSSTHKALHDELHKLVSTHTVVLFMKGTPTFPRCGFSSKVAQILKQCGLKEYMAVDMLSRPDLKAELVKYADWPTLPALYINGEFIGGCDITTEMYQEGELQPLLQNTGLL